MNDSFVLIVTSQGICILYYGSLMDLDSNIRKSILNYALSKYEKWGYRADEHIWI